MSRPQQLLYWLQNQRIVIKRLVDLMHSTTEFKRKVSVLSVTVFSPYNMCQRVLVMDRRFGLTILTFCRGLPFTPEIQTVEKVVLSWFDSTAAVLNWVYWIPKIMTKFMFTQITWDNAQPGKISKPKKLGTLKIPLGWGLINSKIRFPKSL